MKVFIFMERLFQGMATNSYELLQGQRLNLPTNSWVARID